MNAVLDSVQMKKCDSYTSEHFGVPSVVLMERAALAVANVAMSAVCAPDTEPRNAVTSVRPVDGKKVLAVCGTGNNGADGLAAARILAERGFDVDFAIPFDNGKHSELFDVQLGILNNYGLKACCPEEFEEYDVILDAVFGIGLSRDLSPEMCEYIDRINKAKAVKIAVDIPSGLNADNGLPMGNAFEADITVTFGFKKLGQVVTSGTKYVGELVCEDIGITERSLECLEEVPASEMIFGDLVSNLPERPAQGNKGTFGKVLVFAGSEGMPGACILASKAAFKSGAGMVRIISCKENLTLVTEVLPEAMTIAAEDEAAVSEALGWCDVILMGPGIGKSKKSRRVMKLLLEKAGSKIVVIDADGLNILAEDEEISAILKGRGEGTTILTPHMGEFARLSGKSVKEIAACPARISKAYSRNMNAILVLKDAVTVVTCADEMVIINAGNNGMATAGSGDVLAGITAALCAFEPKAADDDKMFKAVCNAVYLHGYAGHICTESMPTDSVMAGDIASALPEAIGNVRALQH